MIKSVGLFLMINEGSIMQASCCFLIEFTDYLEELLEVNSLVSYSLFVDVNSMQ